LSKQQFAFKTTRAFDRSFPALPLHIQERTLAKLALYEKEPRHPLLRVKKLKGTTDIWEMSVTKKYRITFQSEGGIILLRNIGSHDILGNTR
jgi:mRNA-degrading endonuclease YafQ of YafQ-DinJ toxin-antitoxin module